MQKINIIVLAAGHGKRMGNNGVPKVLLPFKGKPVIEHLLKAIKKTQLCKKPIIVIGVQANKVKRVLGSGYTYVFQEEQLGTAHAVSCCKNILKDRFKHILVLYGDHPLLTAETIKKIINKHISSGNILTMATFKIADFNSWRHTFFEWGRIIRDKQRKISAIVEYKDADIKQRLIREVNPSYFCFKNRWLWDNLDKISNQNSQKEYYLTDIVQIATSQKLPITSVEINPIEALGINTPEQLNQALLIAKKNYNLQ